MLKQIDEPIKETAVNSIFEFVHKFKQQEQFKKKFGVNVENWDFGCTDDEAIEDLLTDMNGLYRCVYDNGSFIIEEYENG